MNWATELERDLDWRLAELSALKFQATRASTGSILQSALLRALVAMLYAHYEGFCKKAIRIYLREIKVLNVKRMDCKERLAHFSLQKALRESRSYNSDECWSFYKSSLGQMLQDAIDYEYDRSGEIALVGESNLYPADLKTNLDFACLPQTEVDNNEHLLKQLVGRRNGIAHGQQLQVENLAKYEEYERAATSVMYEVTVSIIDSLTNQSYCKPIAYHG